jgi:D-serine deaminase-like pyridoxal phosphate-dependent protein
VKTHKMPQVARLQVGSGAQGITCQKLGEAELMAAHGFDDILITFPLVGTGKAERFARLAGRVRLTVGADSAVVARTLSAALASVGSTAWFLVDCDTGLGRTGVESPAAAADLGDLVAALPNLEFAGLMTHPASPASGLWLREARRLLEARGLAVDWVSGGGTPGAFDVHEIGVFTELRVGSYIFGDRSLVARRFMAIQDAALRVTTTVVSRPTGSRAILDAGSKTLSSDAAAGVEDGAYGFVVEHPGAVVYELSEEHANLDVARCDPKPEIGDVLTVIPNHACAVVNLHDQVALHREEADVELAEIPGLGLVR